MNYVVLDLEMCKVPKSGRQTFPSSHEIIQIGAVELDEQFQVVDTFMTYVRPQFGAIDSFIRRLTGITPEDTKTAPTTAEALRSFADWLPADTQLVTWSENDVRQIDDELYFKKIEMQELYDCMYDYIDCQELFAEKLDRDRQYSLKEALTIAGLDYDAHLHDALVDARNTADLFSKVQTEEKLVLSPYYMTAEDMEHYRRQYAFC